MRRIRRRTVGVMLSAAMALSLITPLASYAGETTEAGNTDAGKAADLVSMDYDSLYSLKQSVDAELYSRPEAEPLYWPAGFYTVGKDINPGRYYVIMPEPGDHSGTRMHVYASRTNYDERPSGQYGEYLVDEYVKLGDDAISVDLAEGNFLYIEGPIAFSVSEFSEEDYYQYEAPEGTYVAAGVYSVGEGADMPVGTYLVYPATIAGGDVKLYNSMSDYESDGSWHLGYDSHIEVQVTRDLTPETIKVNEGGAVLVESDVIMKKQGALSFD